DPRPGDRDHGRGVRPFPARRGIRGRVRHHHLRARVDPRRGPHPAGRGRPGRAGGDPVPPVRGALHHPAPAGPALKRRPDPVPARVTTLLEAVLLVVLVVILFLQTWRASIIPLLAVPVSIVGTFAVLHLLGFSINTLTLFGLVLAIGIVVDDAIVVVENVERHIEDGATPLQAAHRAMKEVSSPIIAIGLVLCAVFVPMAFLTGVTGQFYQQFAVTIAISTVISTINSLTLSPALAARLLKSHDAPKDVAARIIDRLFGWRLQKWVFRPFN